MEVRHRHWLIKTRWQHSCSTVHLSCNQGRSSFDNTKIDTSKAAPRTTLMKRISVAGLHRQHVMLMVTARI